MAARSDEEKHDLSLALMAIAGSLLVGNFATFSTYISLTNDRGDNGVIIAVIASSVFLVLSIVNGGWRRYNLQAWLGAGGVLVSLLPPVLAMTMRDVVPNPNARSIDNLETHVAALAKTEADQATSIHNIDERNVNLEAQLQELDRRFAAIEAAAERKD